jgi:D-alanyl-D-alanine carboxypeptidase/D-alanyl-D-alanine-endopeptidase (penicillin-binding protein 4)
MKILTSIAGLMNLGEYYTFRTDLFHTGVIANDTLYGDIIVAGGFDPDFTTEDLDSLVRIVKSLGISYITGGIYADVSKKDSLYWGEGWMWDDDPAPSAPYLSALNINDNSIEVFVEGTEVDSAARVHLIPETDFISVENNSKTVSAIHPNKFSINRDWVGRKNKIIIDGEVRNASLIDTADHKEKINLLFPEKYFITLFNEHLEKEGIYVQKRYEVKKLPDNAVYLNSIYRPIDTVLSDLNKESDNLNAEMIIYAIAYKDSGAPAYAKDGLAAIYRLIDSLGLNSDEYYIADGSGISHYNLITAELLVEMLKYIYYKSKDLFELFYNSLSIAGIDGTLEKRMWNTYAEGNVHGKTGTLMGVSTLSGYVTAKNGNLIAFSILIQNFVDRYSVARRFQDRICALLSELE